jgi:hypothetical protein
VCCARVGFEEEKEVINGFVNVKKEKKKYFLKKYEARATTHNIDW